MIGFLTALVLQYSLIVTIGHELAGLGMTAAQKSWYAPIYGWLAASPLTGFWGIAQLDAGAPGWWNGPVGALAIITAAVMTTLVLVYLVASFGAIGANVTQRLIAGLIVAGLLESAIFLACRQYWSAGQGILCIAPLCLVEVIGWCAGSGRQLLTRRHPLGWVLTAGLAVLVLGQAWVAILRPVLIVWESDDLRYVNSPVMYRAVDMDLGPIQAMLAHNPPGRMGLMIANPYLTRLVRLNFVWTTHLIEFVNAPDAANTQVDLAADRGVVDVWLWEKALLPPDLPKDAEIARTDSLVLTKSAAMLIDERPLGLRRDPQSGLRFFWISKDQPAVVRINVPEEGTVELTGRFVAGPGVPGLDSRQIEIFADAAPAPKTMLVDPQTTQIKFRVRAGINTLRITCLDEPTAGNPGEPVLMLEIIDPSVKFHASSAAAESGT